MGSIVIGESLPFQAHLELLQVFLAHRDDIVERIQGVLNAQRRPIEYLRDGSLLSRHFEDCFYIGSPRANRVSELNWKTRIGPVDSDLVSLRDCINAATLASRLKKLGIRPRDHKKGRSRA